MIELNNTDDDLRRNIKVLFIRAITLLHGDQCDIIQRG